MKTFHQTLSAHSVYLRYFEAATLAVRVAHERLVRICSPSDREMVLVAEHSAGASAEIVAVGRLSKIGNREAEAAILVADQFQRHGLGSELLRRLLDVGRDQGLRRIVLYMLRENLEMQELGRKQGFHLERSEDPNIIVGVLDLVS